MFFHGILATTESILSGKADGYACIIYDATLTTIFSAPTSITRTSAGSQHRDSSTNRFALSFYVAASRQFPNLHFMPIGKRCFYRSRSPWGHLHVHVRMVDSIVPKIQPRLTSSHPISLLRCQSEAETWNARKARTGDKEGGTSSQE
uniref:Uncharacterized protein n=1 Tax=Vespula pensylvanica TaxID=30213 RepID=A0A834NS90_VESPE|nr:hypothetical protein H0235_011572 [Vespula pensylvanica]